VEALLKGQPDAPFYFGRMKHQNKSGPALLQERTLERYETASLGELLDSPEILFVDTRARREFATGAIRGSLNIPAGGSFREFSRYNQRVINGSDEGSV